MTDWFRSRLSRIERADGAVFVYVGRAEEVFLFGDMTDWIDRRPLTRAADTDLFFREERYEPDARLQYWLASTYAATLPTPPQRRVRASGAIPHRGPRRR